MPHTCSANQVNALLDFLYEHKDLARGLLRTADGRARAKRLWEEITQLLNSMGGSVKTVKQWQKVWTDRKHAAKKNAAAVRRMQMGTGGGPSSASLGQWEIRVLDIMGEGFGGPQTTARVQAFPTINIEEEVAQYEVPLTEPELPLSEGGLVGTSAILSSIPLSASTVEIATADGQIEILPPSPESLASRPVQSRSPSRQSSRTSRPRHLTNTVANSLIQIEREKIGVFNHINERLSGIEKAILELVKLKQDNTNS